MAGKGARNNVLVLNEETDYERVSEAFTVFNEDYFSESFAYY